jgi:hypothetical protein
LATVGGSVQQIRNKYLLLKISFYRTSTMTYILVKAASRDLRLGGKPSPTDFDV